MSQGWHQDPCYSICGRESLLYHNGLYKWLHSAGLHKQISVQITYFVLMLFIIVEDELYSYCFKIGEVVAKLHNHNYIHGDLTTSNFMIEEGTGDLVLLDFGLTVLAKANTIVLRIKRDVNHK